MRDKVEKRQMPANHRTGRMSTPPGEDYLAAMQLITEGIIRPCRSVVL